MAHKHSVYDTDLHFVIDPITRKITTECKKTQLMQKDHNSERFTFEIPRYIEGHDMSLCNVVQIHYINTNSTNKDYQVQDIYEVNDLQLSPDSEDIVIGSWLISSNATTYSGTLNFVIRFACVDEETKAIDYQWFTDIYSAITVAKTIYNVDVVTEGESSDLLEKWKEEISKAADESTLELAQEAKKSEQAASDSASAASQSEKNAGESATNAASSAQSASDDARAAIESSNSAQQSAGTASEKAAEALESAESASSSASSAVDSATAASASAILAESYTHGRTGTREGEDTDNAKYYMEQTKAVSIVDVATTEKAGIVKPDGTTITADADGTIHGANTYELPVATTDTLGGVKPDGTTITADADGTIHGANTYELPVATTDTLGGVKPDGTTITADADGTIHGANTYELPVATTDTLGGVKPDGTTITADADGTIRVNADSELSATSTNPVQNKVVKSNIDTLQSEIDSTKKDITFKSIDTATDGTSFTDAEDGNMLVTDCTKNLLNPTLETTTNNGVTCTNNGDGTYTLNGTSTGQPIFWLNENVNVIGSNLKLVCCPPSILSDDKGYSKIMYDNDEWGEIESGDGIVINSGRNISRVIFTLNPGCTVNNLVIKPMITTDLSATYDDFVPYGGYEIQSCGKNLFHIRDDIFSGENTYSGVTFTRSDGKLILNGTSTSSFIDTIGYFDYIDGIDKYTFSGWDTSKISPIQDTIGLYSNDEYKFDFGNGAKTDTTINRNRLISLVFKSGQVFDNFVLQPIVIAGHTDLYYSDFEPYTGETITVTNDTESPAFGLKSHKGITNIISQGNVKCVYPTNESGKGVLDAMYNNSQLSNELSKLKDAIIAMGGTV